MIQIGCYQVKFTLSFQVAGILKVRLLSLEESLNRNISLGIKVHISFQQQRQTQFGTEEKIFSIRPGSGTDTSSFQTRTWRQRQNPRVSLPIGTVPSFPIRVDQRNKTLCSSMHSPNVTITTFLPERNGWKLSAFVVQLLLYTVHKHSVVSRTLLHSSGELPKMARSSTC